MVGAQLARWRWRRRGAWLWPTFVVLTAVDGVLLHALPVAGDSQALAGGLIAGLVLNLLAVVLFSRPLGIVWRHWRGDMPAVVARNYGGAAAVVLISLAVLAAGLAHRASIQADQRALDDAVVRAVAFIGDRAPLPFRANAGHTSTYTIQPGYAYRVCVPDRAGIRTYCVIVRSHLPAGRSVVFGGYEPNSVFSEGTS
jgi:hypothetical protein